MIRHLIATVFSLTIAAVIAATCYALSLVDYLIFGSEVTDRLTLALLLPASFVGGLVVIFLAINYWLCLRSTGFVAKLLTSVTGWLRWKWTMRRLDSFSFANRS